MGKTRRTESKTKNKAENKTKKRADGKTDHEFGKTSGATDVQGGKILPERYRTVYQNGEGRYEEKKSVFLAAVRHVTSVEEAASFVEEMKKKYWDARHNCSGKRWWKCEGLR